MEPDELDDLLAEMKGEKAAETADQVHSRVTALIAAVDHNANVDQGVVPQGVAPQPVVVLDSIQHDIFGPARLDIDIGDSTDGGIVELIIRSGGRGFDTANLKAHVTTINKAYRPKSVHAATPEITEYESAIVHELTLCQSSLADLRVLVADPTLDMPLPQAAAVIRFHKTYPQVWPQLVKAGVRVLFNSRASDTRGGGLFDNNTIYVSKLFVTPAGAFIRLLVHEMGHALFETSLLNHKTMPHDLVTDRLTDLLVPVAQSALRDRSKNCQDIQHFWDDLSAPAKIFYQAWRVLRQNRGACLLGVDLWEDPARNRLWPAQRRPYQANNFGEFCAEVFMLYAMGDLQTHVVAILGNGDIQQNVKTAWKNAWHVLELVATPILGPRVHVL